MTSNGLIRRLLLASSLAIKLANISLDRLGFQAQAELVMH
jgi:hypothetical protein